MSKTYLPYDPDQQLLLPAALREWLPDDHLAYFISDVVDQLDLSSITARYEGERRGGPPYHPRMMVKVLLYGYCIGVASSRRIAQRLHEDIAFRVLAANNTPDFRTISDFRKDHLGALSGLFLQVLAFCQRAGLVKLGHVALVGVFFGPGCLDAVGVHQKYNRDPSASQLLLVLDALIGIDEQVITIGFGAAQDQTVLQLGPAQLIPGVNRVIGTITA